MNYMYYCQVSSRNQRVLDKIEEIYTAMKQEYDTQPNHGDYYHLLQELAVMHIRLQNYIKYESQYRHLENEE